MVLISVNFYPYTKFAFKPIAASYVRFRQKKSLNYHQNIIKNYDKKSTLQRIIE
jgi:hypothetical protein